MLALVGLGDQPRAWPLHAKQTPAEMAFQDNKISQYIHHLRINRAKLPEGVVHVLADSLYANLAFLTAVRDMDLHLVSKLRKDADLRYLYQGPQKTHGRRRLYDGKVDFEDWSRWERLEVDEEGLEGYTLVVNHKSFREEMRVVVIFPKGKADKRRVLMSTDTRLSGQQVVQWYKGRFQIEFVIRDAKGHMGLCDGQMRTREGLDFHFNASLAALNTLYAQEQAKRAEGTLSLASIRRRKYNETLINLIFSKLDLDPTSQKVASVLDELRHYGVIAA